MATKKMSAWRNCGTIGTPENIVAEPTVDATFRIVEAFDTSSGLNNVTADLSTGVKSLTITDAGDYLIPMFVKFDGSAKTFEFALFVNGVESLLKINDRANENTAVAPILPLPAGAVLDVRQRSIDGGTNLTVNTIGLTVTRQV